MRILIADDHAETRELLLRTLAAGDHHVRGVATCADARAELQARTFDVLVLDVMLPDGSGIELCARLRATNLQTPILLLTARGEVPSRVAGLEAGADDYLAKPFAVAELRARVKALSRRGPRLRERTLTLGAVVVDFEGRRVRIDGCPLQLTGKELAIVELLATRHGRIVERDDLIESIWGDVGDTQRATLDVLIGRIRRKLGGNAGLLRTVRGIGYVFGDER